MKPQDEFIHDYPKNLDTPWKENWYFNFVDRKNRAWGISHITLMRHIQKGRFSTIHVIDGQIIPYSNLIDISNLKTMSDDKLTFEVIEPFEKFRVTFNGPQHQLDLTYDARFPMFNFGVPDPDGKVLTVEHYRQSLIARGTITKEGETRPIESFCDRDHTWGYRDEGKLTGWNCCHAYFDDKTLIIFRFLTGTSAYGTGYLSTAKGNTRITRVEVEDTKFVDNIPVSSIFKAYDGNGNCLGKLRSEKFSGLVIPHIDKENKNEKVTVYENFSEFTNLETGQKGDGVDEYLINANEAYHQNPGVQNPDP